jgi:hypothetical protein
MPLITGISARVKSFPTQKGVYQTATRSTDLGRQSLQEYLTAPAPSLKINQPLIFTLAGQPHKQSVKTTVFKPLRPFNQRHP